MEPHKQALVEARVSLTPTSGIPYQEHVVIMLMTKSAMLFDVEATTRLA